jgi:hypothetical protein
VRSYREMTKARTPSKWVTVALMVLRPTVVASSIQAASVSITSLRTEPGSGPI